MKILPVQNHKCEYKNSPDFMGKIVVPEKMTKMGKEFIEENFEHLNKLVAKEPYDVFIKELPEHKYTMPFVFMVEKGVKPNKFVGVILYNMVEEFARKNELEALKKEFEKQDFDLKKITEKIVVVSEQKPPNPKPYVPRKIGIPQKPFIRKRRY